MCANLCDDAVCEEQLTPRTWSTMRARPAGTYPLRLVRPKGRCSLLARPPLFIYVRARRPTARHLASNAGARVRAPALRLHLPRPCGRDMWWQDAFVRRSQKQSCPSLSSWASCIVDQQGGGQHIELLIRIGCLTLSLRVGPLPCFWILGSLPHLFSTQDSRTHPSRFHTGTGAVTNTIETWLTTSARRSESAPLRKVP
jgi:hypothetical protein